jgi:SAM-dependent methyltransferase
MGDQHAPVDKSAIANVDMARAWDGPDGDDWTDHADRYEASGRWIWARFEQDVPIGPADDVLDVGCGTGKSTLAAARRAQEGAVLGVDLSSRMLERARARAAAERVTNVTFLQADAQVEPFTPASRDLLISSYGAMFFADPVAAFSNLATALRRGGRLAFLTWRRFEENEWLSAIRRIAAQDRELPNPPVGVPGPFGLADRDEVVAILDAAGYRDVEIAPRDEPIYLGADADGAWEFVRVMGIVTGLTAELDDASRADVFAQLRALVDEHAGPDGVALGAASWLVTAARS